MPQLILYPWFLIFLFTWLSFLTFIPKKILSYAPLNTPTPNPLHYQFSPWSWPWL